MVEIFLKDRVDEICVDGDDAHFESVDGVGMVLRVYETGDGYIATRVTGEFKADDVQGWRVDD